jgi:MATE family multidrug resistance protein
MRLAWPITVSMLSYSTMTLVDTLFVGRLGSAALAGVGLGGISTWALICFSLGLLRGAKVLVSQAVGAGKREEIGMVLGATVLWAVALGAVTVAAGWIAAPLLPSLAATPAAGDAAVEYFRVRTIGAPVVMLFWGTREVRQGLGDTRWPMVASVCANVVNVALDYALIFGLGLGVTGAAAASVAASAVELGLLVALTRSPNGHGVGWRHLKALWWVGWPSGMELVVEMGSFTALTVLISRFSEVHMAAHQVALQVLHFSFLPAFAISDAASVLAGQAVGAGRLSLVPRVARLAMVAAGIYTAACSLSFVLCGRAISGLFTDSLDLAQLATRLLWVAAVFQVADAGAMVARGVLRGTGDVRYPAVVGTLAAWALTPPAMWLLGYHAGLGALGGWIGISMELLVTCTAFWLRLSRGRWHAAAARARSIATDGGLSLVS